MTHKYQEGDKVVFTNEFGVCWGVRTITGLCDPYTEGGEPRYFIEPTDCPWFSTAESTLTKAGDRDIVVDQMSGPLRDAYFQKTYGRPTTREQRASLLDTDPWAGEEL